MCQDSLVAPMHRREGAASALLLLLCTAAMKLPVNGDATTEPKESTFTEDFAPPARLFAGSDVGLGGSDDTQDVAPQVPEVSKPDRILPVKGLPSPPLPPPPATTLPPPPDCGVCVCSRTAGGGLKMECKNPGILTTLPDLGPKNASITEL